MGGPRGPEWRTASDWLPVVAVAVVSQAAIGLEQPWNGSVAGLALSSLLLAMPLAVRRARPLLTDVLLAGALFAQMALGGSLHFGSFVAVLVAAYATGRHTTTWRPAALGAAALLGGALGATFANVLEHPEEAFFPAFYITAAVALGRVVHRQVRQAADLRAANAALARERDTAARLAVATERVRLARELHDVVAHMLTVMVVQAEAAEESLDRDPETVRHALERIQDAGRSGLGDLRSMVRVLRSEDSDHAMPVLADLPTLVAVLGEGGLDVHLRTEGNLDDVDPELGAQLFRVVQESLTNIVRHSAATTATVTIARAHDGITLEVRDPGPSLSLGSTGGPAGHGIRGMGERVAVFGGTVQAGQLGGGFAVQVRVPGSASRTVDEPANR